MEITRRAFLRSTAAGAAGLALGAPAAGETRSISDLAALKDALENRANPGDVLLLQPGVYRVDAPRLVVRRSGTLDRPITLRGVLQGEQRPVLDASGTNIRRGILGIVAETHDWVFENLELRNARGSGGAGETYSNNAAAAYIEGSGITFRNCYSHHNDNGWFSTHGAANTVLEACETAYNGKPREADGHPTHNHYVNSTSLTVRYCYIHHSTEGQNFKSRCEHAVLAYNWIEEEGNYGVEVASGNEGNTLWIGNVMVKRAAPGGQRRLLGVGDGTGVARGTLAVIHNTFLTTQERDLFLYSHPSATTDLLLYNNVFAGPGTTLFAWGGQGRVEGAGNWFRRGLPVPEGLSASLTGDDPGFVDADGRDLRSRADSPLRGAGVESSRWRDAHGTLVGIRPTHQPRRRTVGADPRVGTGGPDVGALGQRPSD